MPAVIINDECTGCGDCEYSCPLDVIYMHPEEEIAYIKYPEECWHCGSCRQDCSVGAIEIHFPLRSIVTAGTIPY